MAETSTAAPPEARDATRVDGARSLSRRTAAGTFAAVVLALAVRAVAVAVNSGLWVLDPFAAGAIVGSAVAAGAGAAVVYAGAIRYTRRSVRTFLAAAAVVFVGPELGVGTGGQVWLVVLHVAVAVPLVFAITRLGSRPDAR